MLENLLETLGFDPDEIPAYLLLVKLGPLPAGIIAKKLGKPRASVYGYLARLKAHGLVIQSEKAGVKIFSPERPEKINILFEEKLALLKSQQEQYKKMLPELSVYSEKFNQPKFSLFEGAEGLRHALKDMLLFYDLETYAFWPQKKMVEILGGDFFEYHNKERVKNRLSVKAIWPENQKVSLKEHPYFGVGEKFLREIRIAPKKIDFTMGYWIYGHRTVFVSSIRESFGFIIDSLEFAETQKAQFLPIWNMSEIMFLEKIKDIK